MAEHRKSQRYNTLGERWFRDQFEAHLPWLEALDEHPKPLEDFLEEHPTRLLGKRFELLIRFWLEQSPHFRLHASGVPLYDAGKTVGEVDFILEEVDSGTWTHLEVACKFYLGYNNSKQWHDWRGPNAQDTLKLKMDKLDRQLSSLLMKGYLFHHYRTHPQSAFVFASRLALDFGFGTHFSAEGWWVPPNAAGWLHEGSSKSVTTLPEVTHPYLSARGHVLIEERMRGFKCLAGQVGHAPIQAF